MCSQDIKHFYTLQNENFRTRKEIYRKPLQVNCENSSFSPPSYEISPSSKTTYCFDLFITLYMSSLNFHLESSVPEEKKRHREVWSDEIRNCGPLFSESSVETHVSVLNFGIVDFLGVCRAQNHCLTSNLFLLMIRCFWLIIW